MATRKISDPEWAARQSPEKALTLSDFDCCECGDYRHQHVNGSGACKLGSLCTPGRCQKFRLSREATEIPAPYAPVSRC